MKHFRNHPSGSSRSCFIEFMSNAAVKLYFSRLDIISMTSKLSVFELFSRILKSSSRLPKTNAHQELLTFIKHIIRRYFKLSKENPLLILDLLYSKTRSDCRRIQFGDENIKSKSVFIIICLILIGAE
jgi:hypothetical protein